MSLHIVKFFSRPLSIISAALLIHVGGAVAAGSAGDAQQQARRLLLGVTDSGVQGTKRITRPDNAAAPVESTVQKGVPVHGDAQAMARRLLLGQANAAGS